MISPTSTHNVRPREIFASAQFALVTGGAAVPSMEVHHEAASQR